MIGPAEEWAAYILNKYGKSLKQYQNILISNSGVSSFKGYSTSDIHHVTNILNALNAVTKGVEFVPEVTTSGMGAYNDPITYLKSILEENNEFYEAINYYHKINQINKDLHSDLLNFQKNLKELTLIQGKEAKEARVTEIDSQETVELKKADEQQATKANKNLAYELELGTVLLTASSLTMFWVGVAPIPSLLTGLAVAVPVAFGAKIYLEKTDEAKLTPKARYQNEENKLNKEIEEVKKNLPKDMKKYVDQFEALTKKVPRKSFDKNNAEENQPKIDKIGAKKFELNAFKKVLNVQSTEQKKTMKDAIKQAEILFKKPSPSKK